MKVQVYNETTKQMETVEDFELDLPKGDGTPPGRCPHGRIWEDLCADCAKDNSSRVHKELADKGNPPCDNTVCKHISHDPETKLCLLPNCACPGYVRPSMVTKGGRVITCTHYTDSTYQNLECNACFSKGTGQGGYSGKGWGPACNHGADHPVFRIGNCDVFAMASSKWYWSTKNGGLVLDCTNTGGRPLLLPPGYGSLQSHWRPAKNTIYVPWEDREAPPLAFGFWPALIAKLPAKLIVTCMAAHGRTGTALAALALTADPKLTYRDAIRLVREAHCTHAVEAAAQEEYLSKLAACKWRKKLAKAGVNGLLVYPKRPAKLAKDAETKNDPLFCKFCHTLPCKCARAGGEWDGGWEGCG